MSGSGDLVEKGFGRAGIRLAEDPPATLEYHRMEDAAPRMLAVHRFDKAHVVSLVEEGLIPREDGAALLRGLLRMEERGVLESRTAVGGGMHSAERYLIRELGEEVGGRIHLGRSSGDLNAVSFRLTVRRHLTEILRVLAATRRALLSVARREIDTVMPGYTHGQHAQPITFAHWLSMWSFVFERDAARLFGVLDRLDESPAGAGAIAGSEFPLNRDRTAELLGFRRPSGNTLDAIHSHDLDLECLSALAILASNLARLGEDLTQWSTVEFGFVELADRYCMTSSVLAQKKNPNATQAMEAVAAMAVGALSSAFYVNKDPTAQAVLDQAPAVQSPLWRVCELLQARLGELPDLLTTMTVHRERMAQLAGEHWALATDVAGVLVRERDLPWRTAHQIVGILVRRSLERGIAPGELRSKMIDDAAQEYMGKAVGLDEDDLREALDAEAGVRRRSLVGGPAPTAVETALESSARRLDAEDEKLAALERQEATAEVTLQAAIDGILTTSS